VRSSDVRGIIKKMRPSVALLTVVALMAVAIMPLHVALAQQANPTRILPDKVYRGETFNVTVTFSAPADNFQLVSLTDVAPAGWNVTVNGGWCTPPANVTKATGNKTELIWTGVYDEGTNFTALYKVTVPNDAGLGNYNFTGFLGYYLAYPGPYYEDTTGGPQVEVVLRPEISFSPANLSFTAVKGGSNPGSKTLEIWNKGGETLSWMLTDDAAWLNEAPMNGNSTGEHDNVTVSVNITGMSAGDYFANITITAMGANNTPQVVLVSLHISLAPEISFSPPSLSFSAIQGGANPGNQTLEIWNSGGGMLNWTVSDDAVWLNEAPMNGNSTGEHDNVTVSVNITGMSAGDYFANITITAMGANNTPQVVLVSLHISLAPEISFSPPSLSFSAIQGGANPGNQTLEIWNSGGGMLNWTVSDDAVWLNEAPMNGNSTGEHDIVTVSANITGKSAGDYAANITITAMGASNTPQVVPVSLHISPPSEISFSPPSLSFSAIQGGANPENQMLEIWNSGGGMLNWSLSNDAGWLSEAPASGSSTGEHDNVTVVVNITGMSAGDYSANINITAPGVNNTPQVVPVSLHISPPPEICFSPPSLSFSATRGGANPENQMLEIWNSGGGMLNWSLSNDAGWLSEIPENGTSSSEHNNVTVAVDIIGMSAGDYSANITITAMGANNTSQVVPVSLHISPPGGGEIGGGGGGGGGGGSCYLDIDMLGKITRVKISCVTGTTLKPAVAPDVNNTNFLEIDRGTRVICDDTSKAPTVLVMRVANESPPVPDGSVIIGSVYNFTGNYTLSSCGNRNTPHCCSGVTFDQNVTIVLNYDPNELPESTASLAVAYYDTNQGSWVSLPTDVGRVAEIGKATGLISHASAVAIIAELAPTPPPASFVASGLNIEQNPQVRKNIFVAVTGENVTITGSVANNGGQEGTYIAELKLNGETIEAKEVALAAGQSRQVSFTLSGMDYGQYEVEVAGLSGEFTVSRSIDGWSIFDIIAAVGLITWGAIWWRRRRKPAQPAQPTQSE